MCTSCGCRRGFTLIELVLAMGVCAFGLLGVSGLLLILEQTEAEQVMAARALFCAQQKMEILRYQSLQQGLSSPEEGKEALNQEAFHGTLRHWTIRPSPSHQGLLWIQVDCSCSYKGKSISRNLQTLMLPNG